MEEQTKELLAAKTTTSTAEAEIDSRTSVEEKEKEIEELVEKVQSMEKAMKELNDKLKVTNRHLKVMAREREHKQKECEVLRRKVEMVELKMCELQGTFDMLVKAVMVERDNVIKDMEDKTGQIDDLQQTLVRLKDTHEQELENVLYEKRLLDDELSRYRSGELRSSAVAVVEQRDFDVVTQEKQTLEIQVKQKTEETKILQDKVENIQHDMTEFVASLKDEMQRLKEDSEKVKAEKNDLTATFTTLHAEHLDLTNRHQQLEMSFQELEKSKREKTDNLESLRLQLEDLQHQLEDVNTKNIKTTAVMRTKEEEFREELAAREGTIQELTITLTNNQKQSMENYNALLDDKTALEIKYKNILTEKEKLKKDLDEKLTLLQEEKSQEVKELQEKIKSMMEELNKVKSELSEPVRAGEEQDKVASSQVNTDAPSHPPPTVGECGEVADREELIKVITKRGQDLKEALESTHNKLDAKEEEIRTLVEEDIPKLRQTIKELTMELEALKQKSASAGTFESHEQFESVIAAKEEKIRELESKVGELDKCTAYITQLEGRLQETSAAPNTLESQLEQINQLSADISKLKEELQQSCKECEALKVTVTELQNENKNLQNEKSKLVEEYEKKLEEARNNVEEASSQLEEKKNSVERLERELSSSISSHLAKVSLVERNHMSRVAELVKLHRYKVEDLRVSNAAQLGKLHKHIEDLYQEKAALNDQLQTIKFSVSSSQREITLEQERDSLQSHVITLQHNVESLEKEKLQIEEEKRLLKNGFEEEQIMALEMQSQMVSDLEQLILNLESEKGSLEKELANLRSSCDAHSASLLESEKKVAVCEDLVVNLAKEKASLKEEIKGLKEIIGGETVSRISEDHHKTKTIEELTAKLEKLETLLEKAQIALEEQEDVYALKLKEEKDDHMMQLKALRKELNEEVGVIQERKEQVALEYEDKIGLIIAEYQEQLSSLASKHEARLLEEKAEFGRVLVSKIDEYEGRLATQAADIKSYEAQLDVLQGDIDNKAKVIEELECSLDEMTLMRAALRAQVDDLKLSITKINEGTEGSYLDVLHADYQSRLTEVQEHYEAQLAFLRSLLSGAESEVQRATCSSPSQDSEYSIELSCLRPYLQGQSSPIADLALELRSHSAQGSQSGFLSETDTRASCQSCHILARSSSSTKCKEEIRSYSSADGKIGITLTSLTAHLRTKSISKAKSKCKSNGSIPRLLLNSASRSELKQLQATLGNKNKSKMLANLPQGSQQTNDLTGNTCQTHTPNSDSHSVDNTLDGSRHDSYIPSPLFDSALSSMGARPRPPRRSAAKFKSFPPSKQPICFDVEPCPATDAISSTGEPCSATDATVPSSAEPYPALDAGTTPLDKVKGLALLKRLWTKLASKLRRRRPGLPGLPGRMRGCGRPRPPIRPSRRK
ncbi:hypothetical protein OTU49_004613 [Cherax quadricarinatus]|uniref:Uncharacterized protein n=1 Tax=Cherax quadricarinatus TaxID=27406 RepID=A0AAW0Y9V3_CHEQU